MFASFLCSSKTSPYLGTETPRAEGGDIVTQSRAQEIRQNHIFTFLCKILA
jgi:hypothetical protein